MLAALEHDTNPSAKICDFLMILNHLRFGKSRHVRRKSRFADDILKHFGNFEAKSIDDPNRTIKFRVASRVRELAAQGSLHFDGCPQSDALLLQLPEAEIE
jgi:hypothetical protein